MKTKKVLSAVLTAAVLSTALLSGCGGGSSGTPQNTSSGSASSAGTTSDAASADLMKLPENGGYDLEYTPSKDKYRTFYEIFPYSFCDSDGDGIGDFKGMTSKLDYLNDGDTKTRDDLGVEGIWLMPIMPSPSYHKYDVTDYKNIDPAYGTLDDFKEFLEGAHKRDINVIIDLVLNHSSKNHPWYKQAIAELKEGKTDGYAQYYHFDKEQKNSGWRPTGVDGWYYESNFSPDMPDLNLKNEKLREEIKDIVKFWLDMGVDGFRLDAVLWFESTGNDDSIADLKWLYDYAKSVKSDVYMVGECWTDSGTVANYYKSGVDSFFDFAEEGASGRVSTAIRSENAIDYVKAMAGYQKKIEENNPDAINTPFISNHDTGRSAGFLMTDTARRMAACLYILTPGNSFVYYGEEIGMTGSKSDPDKRTGMYWSAEDKTGYVPSIPGSSNKDVPDKAVDEQQKDEKSLLNFYKKVIALKNQNPAIARGKLTAVDVGSTAAAGYICDDNGDKVLVMFNTGSKSEKVEIPEDKFKVSEVRGYVLADAGDSDPGSAVDVDALLGDGSSEEEADSKAENVTEFSVSGQTIEMPAFSAIVIK